MENAINLSFYKWNLAICSQTLVVNVINQSENVSHGIGKNTELNLKKSKNLGQLVIYRKNLLEGRATQMVL